MKRQAKYILRSTLCAALLSSFIGFAGSCSEDKIGQDFMAPSISTEGATDVSRTSVTVTGRYSGNLQSIKEYGVKYSDSREFPKDKTIEAPQNGTVSATTTATLTNLSPNTHYYYCWYAKTGASEVRSRAGEFTTSATSKPEFSELTVDTIGEDYARLRCTVTQIGDEHLLEYGVSYKKNSATEKNFTPVAAEELEDETSHEYIVELFNLEPATKYVIRPYAKNSADENGDSGMMEGYGTTMDITTENRMSPEVAGNEPTNVLSTSVKVSGKVTAAIGSNGVIDEIGFCYSSTNDNPTWLDNTVKVEGTKLNELYTATITNLQESTSYYIRMYAKNTVNGTDRYGYGEVFTINTSGLKTPQVSFGSQDIITTATSITISAVIDNYDETALVEKGFIWSRTNGQITLKEAKEAKTYIAVTDGGKTFNGTISGLAPSSQYYIRAYAVYKSTETELEGYTGYSSLYTQGFETVAMEQPEISELSYHSATAIAKITSHGNGTIVEQGFCVSTKTYEVTLENCEMKEVLKGDNFTWKMTGLKSQQQYYIRSYAISELAGKKETTYSWNSSFSTTPITAASFNNITLEQGLLSAKVLSGISSLNNGVLKEKGFIWKEKTGNNDWEFNFDNCTGYVKCEGENIEEFSAKIENLKPSTEYIIKAYAKTEVDGEAITGYSGSYSFWSKGISLEFQSAESTQNSFTAHARVADDVTGIEEYGIAWTSSSDTPSKDWTKAKSTDYDDTEKTFSATVTGLSEGTEYYWRPYVVYNGIVVYADGYSSITTKRTPKPDDNNSPDKKD